MSNGVNSQTHSTNLRSRKIKHHYEAVSTKHIDKYASKNKLKRQNKRNMKTRDHTYVVLVIHKLYWVTVHPQIHLLAPDLPPSVQELHFPEAIIDRHHAWFPVYRLVQQMLKQIRSCKEQPIYWHYSLVSNNDSCLRNIKTWNKGFCTSINP